MNRLLRLARPLRWAGSSSKDIKGFPKLARAAFGFGIISAGQRALAGAGLAK